MQVIPNQIFQKAEWDVAKLILMHTPRHELFMGILHPAAALYEKTFSPSLAAKEHKNYISLLKQQGIQVITIQELLLQGTLDENENVIEGQALNDLQQFAQKFLTYDYSALQNPADIEEQEKYKKQIISSLYPKELYKIILEQPKVKIIKNDINTHFQAIYLTEPNTNLYFMRDQIITTPKGIVIGKMNSEQRKQENDILKFVLNKLKIKPLCEVQGEGRLEGGDFISAGEYVLLGQGLRTNNEALKQLMKQKAFGEAKVVAVKDKWQDQIQMHLDTYFNIIRRDLCVIVEERYLAKNNLKSKMNLTIDIYAIDQKTNEYTQIKKEVDFIEFLEKELKMKIIPVKNEDQLKYGINFLTIREGVIFAVDGVSQQYKDTLKSNGVNATWINFVNMTGGFGAAHCATQVLFREPVK